MIKKRVVFALYPNSHKAGRGRHISLNIMADDKESLDRIVSGLGEIINAGKIHITESIEGSTHDY